MPRFVFAVPYNPNNINPAFVMAFNNMQAIFMSYDVELVIIDCRFDGEKHLKNKVAEMANYVDGIIFPGNPYSIDPNIYGETPLDPKRIDPDSRNYLFAKMTVEIAETHHIPVLGICTGAWYLNVAHGGTLKQTIIPINNVKTKHDADPRDGRVTHDVSILPGTALAKFFQLSSTRVNSWHDQCLGDIAPNFEAAAQAPDGTVEAIVSKDPETFMVGLQFHPEYLKDGDVDEGFLSHEEIIKQRQIFEAMAEAAEKTHRPSLALSLSSVTSSRARFLAFHQAETIRLLSQFNNEHTRLRF